MYLGVTGGKDGLAFPTGKSAADEERTERHAGLYWTDELTSENKPTRSHWVIIVLANSEGWESTAQQPCNYKI